MKTRRYCHTGRSPLLRLAAAVLGLGLFATAAGQSVAWAQELSQRVSPLVVNRLVAGQPQDLIVLFDDSAIEAEAADLRRAAAVPQDTPAILAVKAARYAAQKGDVLSTLPPGEFDTLRDYSHLPIAFVRFRSVSALARLLERFDVVAVREDEAHRPFLTESLPLINQPAVAAAGKIGTGTTVAVLDTGVVYTRSAFGSCTSPGVPASCKVIYAQDFAPDDGALDDMLHGTNVSGIVLGVAPDTRIAALDVFRTDGLAYDSDITAAINWSISNKATYNIVAMNMSLGSGGYTAPCTTTLTTVIASARTAGILTSVASGNDGYTNAISQPACGASSVSVGAVYDANVGARAWSACTDAATFADLVTCFSNSASFLTMLAPGALITAGGESNYAGTSMAAPHVAGAIAVLRAPNAFPSETVDQIVTRMTGTGVSVTDPKNGLVKPRLNLQAAVGGVTTYSLSGQVTTAATGGGGPGGGGGGPTPLAGVTITLSGAAAAAATTDAGGNYSLAGLANGGYVVTPSLTGYSFTPVNRNVTVSGANVTGQNFTAAVGGGNNPPNVPGSPSPANAATGVSLTPTLSWTGGDPDAGNTVTYDIYFGTSASPPLLVSNNATTGYVPGTLIAGTLYYWRIVARDNLGATTNGPTWSFTTTAGGGSFSLSGQVTTAATGGGGPGGGGGGPTPLAGVTITLSGAAAATTTTDAGGNYSLAGLANGGYVVTPSLTGYSFTPVNRNVTVSGANVTGQNFTAAVGGGNNPPNVPGSPSPANAATGVSLTPTLSWTGGDPDAGNTVTYDIYFGTSASPPLLVSNNATTGYVPGTLIAGTLYYWRIVARDNLGATTNGPTWSFTTTAGGGSFSLSGQVTTAATGGGGPGGGGGGPTPLAGVTITLSGAAAATTTTDAGGNYSLAGLANGGYVVTPSLTGYSFTPVNRNVTVSGANVTGQNFTGTGL